MDKAPTDSQVRRYGTAEIDVNRHALLQIHISVKACVSTDYESSNTALVSSTEEVANDLKWFVAIDELPSPYEESPIHREESFDLQWLQENNEGSFYGTQNLTFMLPLLAPEERPNIDRTLLVALVEVSPNLFRRIVTRRLANVPRCQTQGKILNKRQSNPIVSVALNGNSTIPQKKSAYNKKASQDGMWTVFAALAISAAVGVSVAMQSKETERLEHDEARHGASQSLFDEPQDQPTRLDDTDHGGVRPPQMHFQELCDYRVQPEMRGTTGLPVEAVAENVARVQPGPVVTHEGHRTTRVHLPPQVERRSFHDNTGRIVFPPTCSEPTSFSPIDNSTPPRSSNSSDGRDARDILVIGTEKTGDVAQDQGHDYTISRNSVIDEDKPHSLDHSEPLPVCANPVSHVLCTESREKVPATRDAKAREEDFSGVLATVSNVARQAKATATSNSPHTRDVDERGSDETDEGKIASELAFAKEMNSSKEQEVVSFKEQETRPPENETKGLPAQGSLETTNGSSGCDFPGNASVVPVAEVEATMSIPESDGKPNIVGKNESDKNGEASATKRDSLTPAAASKRKGKKEGNIALTLDGTIMDEEARSECVGGGDATLQHAEPQIVANINTRMDDSLMDCALVTTPKDVEVSEEGALCGQNDAFVEGAELRKRSDQECKPVPCTVLQAGSDGKEADESNWLRRLVTRSSGQRSDKGDCDGNSNCPMSVQLLGSEQPHVRVDGIERIKNQANCSNQSIDEKSQRDFSYVSTLPPDSDFTSTDHSAVACTAHDPGKTWDRASPNQPNQPVYQRALKRKHAAIEESGAMKKVLRDHQSNDSKKPTSETYFVDDEDFYVWANLWSHLSKSGWISVRARNPLHDWYYVRPGHVVRGGTAGVDYFLSPDDVIDYAKKMDLKQSLLVTADNEMLYQDFSDDAKAPQPTIDSASENLPTVIACANSQRVVSAPCSDNDHKKACIDIIEDQMHQTTIDLSSEPPENPVDNGEPGVAEVARKVSPSPRNLSSSDGSKLMSSRAEEDKPAEGMSDASPTAEVTAKGRNRKRRKKDPVTPFVPDIVPSFALMSASREIEAPVWQFAPSALAGN